VNGVVSENIGSRSFEEFQEEQRQLAVLVPALGASLGVIVDAGGEKIFVVDDRGRVINDMHFLEAFVSLTVRQAPGVIAVPVYAPSSIEEIVGAHGGRVQRVRASAEAQMSLAAREHPLLVGDGVGGFIFSRFHPSFDGLFATVRLLELLVVAKQTLSEVIDEMPPVHLARLQVACPWEEKGRVMRMLAQDPQTERTRQIDGVKHQSDGEWILVLPDADRPLFNVYAEAKDDNRAQMLVHEYADKLERMRAP
jgi:mannose-1-phosphate guanylyltransferase/phosphomannomutase